MQNVPQFPVTIFLRSQGAGNRTKYIRLLKLKNKTRMFLAASSCLTSKGRVYWRKMQINSQFHSIDLILRFVHSMETSHQLDPTVKYLQQKKNCMKKNALSKSIHFSVPIPICINNALVNSSINGVHARIFLSKVMSYFLFI